MVAFSSCSTGKVSAQLRIAALESQLAREQARCRELEKLLSARHPDASLPSAAETPTSRVIAFPVPPRDDDHRPLMGLGLSAREAEVLFWMSNGKATREIAVIIDAAPGTVRKHCEHIYTKLGVEGHRGAMLRAFEVLQPR